MIEEQIGSYAMRLMIDGVTTVVRSSSRVMMDIVAKYAAERERMSEAEKMQQLYKKHPIEAFLKEGKEPGAITLSKEDAQKVVDPLVSAGVPVYVVADDMSNGSIIAFDKKLSSVVQEYCKRLEVSEYNLEQSSTKRTETREHKLHTNIEKVQNPEVSKSEPEMVREDKPELKIPDLSDVNKAKEGEAKKENFPKALEEKKAVIDLSEQNLTASQEITDQDSLEEKESLTAPEVSKTDLINSQDGLPDPMTQPISLNLDSKNKRKRSFRQEFAKYEQAAKVRDEARRQARIVAKGLEHEKG